jgi:hypothetical protein
VAKNRDTYLELEMKSEIEEKSTNFVFNAA